MMPCTLWTAKIKLKKFVKFTEARYIGVTIVSNINCHSFFTLKLTIK
jgi:hypothetical protein